MAWCHAKRILLIFFSLFYNSHKGEKIGEEVITTLEMRVRYHGKPKIICFMCKPY